VTSGLVILNPRARRGSGNAFAWPSVNGATGVFTSLVTSLPTMLAMRPASPSWRITGA